MAIFVSDVFTDSNGTSLASHTGGTGATWTNDDTGGSATIDSNRVHGGAASTYYHASGAPAGADYTVEADFVYVSQADNIGITGRHVATGTSGHVDGYFLRHRAFFGWQLFRVDVGALTQLGSDVGPELTTSDVKRGKLEMIGSAIKAYVDGALIVSVTDATYSAAGSAGIGINAGGSSTTGVHLDNYAATDAGGGGSTYGPGSSSLPMVGVQ